MNLQLWVKKSHKHHVCHHHKKTPKGYFTFRKRFGKNIQDIKYLRHFNNVIIVLICNVIHDTKFETKINPIEGVEEDRSKTEESKQDGNWMKCREKIKYKNNCRDLQMKKQAPTKKWEKCEWFVQGSTNEQICCSEGNKQKE